MIICSNCLLAVPCFLNNFAMSTLINSFLFFIFLSTTTPILGAPHHLRVHRSVSPSGVVLWPSGIVPFEIDEHLSKAPYIDKIRDAFNQYQQNTCIHFVKRKAADVAFIRFIKQSDCHSSSVGRSGRQQNISLGAGCYSTGTIVHEIGHALGFDHEHTRSDRDQYVTVIFPNIEEDTEKKRQFKANSPSTDRRHTRFDYYSIMIYGNDSFSKGPHHRATMLARDPAIDLTDPSERLLSELDIRAVNLLYNCEENKRKR